MPQNLQRISRNWSSSGKTPRPPAFGSVFEIKFANSKWRWKFFDDFQFASTNNQIEKLHRYHHAGLQWLQFATATIFSKNSRNKSRDEPTVKKNKSLIIFASTFVRKIFRFVIFSVQPNPILLTKTKFDCQLQSLRGPIQIQSIQLIEVGEWVICPEFQFLNELFEIF